MPDNYWDKLMGDEQHAAEYMLTYGEGPGSETREILSNFINVGESVLDVGCGPGWNMDHFAEYGPRLSRYKGVDYSHLFVEVANQRRKQKQYGPDYALPFEVQDCRMLQEPKNSWDVVLLQDILEHTNGYEKPVREALRVARKRVIVTFWRLQDNPGHINDDGDDGYGAHYDSHDWEAFLNKLPYPWEYTETSENANRRHDYYIIEKEVMR